jgi:hypothetical protein
MYRELALSGLSTTNVSSLPASTAQSDRTLPQQSASFPRKVEPALPKNRGQIMRQVINFSICATAVLLAVTSPAMAYTGQELARNAKISIKQARAMALKAHPGEITDQELEKERGGSGLRYSFDIKRGAITQEVGVDAMTGKVLENKKEGPHPD